MKFLQSFKNAAHKVLNLTVTDTSVFVVLNLQCCTYLPKIMFGKCHGIKPHPSGFLFPCVLPDIPKNCIYPS